MACPILHLKLTSLEPKLHTLEKSPDGAAPHGRIETSLPDRRRYQAIRPPGREVWKATILLLRERRTASGLNPASTAHTTIGTTKAHPVIAEVVRCRGPAVVLDQGYRFGSTWQGSAGRQNGEQGKNGYGSKLLHGKEKVPHRVGVKTRRQIRYPSFGRNSPSLRIVDMDQIARLFALVADAGRPGIEGGEVLTPLNLDGLLIGSIQACRTVMRAGRPINQAEFAIGRMAVAPFADRLGRHAATAGAVGVRTSLGATQVLGNRAPGGNWLRVAGTPVPIHSHWAIEVPSLPRRGRHFCSFGMRLSPGNANAQIPRRSR